MAYETFEKIEGIIQGIQRGDSCCSMVVSMISNSSIVNMTVNAETVIIDNVRLRPGMRIAAFYDTNLPVPAIYPPRYQAELITVLKRGQQVKLDYFDDGLVSSDNTLRLNIGPGTNVKTLNGQQYLCSPANSELLVYYTSSTFSVPAQTTPQKIIVLCGY